MDLYLVNAKVIFGEYMEKVEKMMDMEEKPTCYTGSGQRIHKKKIGVVEEGNYRGSFIVYVTQPEAIPHARHLLHEAILQYTKKEYEKAKENLAAAEKRVLTDELPIREE